MPQPVKSKHDLGNSIESSGVTRRRGKERKRGRGGAWPGEVEGGNADLCPGEAEAAGVYRLVTARSLNDLQSVKVITPRAAVLD